VATNVSDYGQLVTGSSPMTEGRHYWEVEVNEGDDVLVGAARPGVDHNKLQNFDSDAYFIGT
jgi:hypothetical protein